jgi:glycosyltransferase involved in cell wall biosynthesis
MRILIHSIYLHPEVGGMESHILHLAEKLIDLGHKVTIVSSRSIKGTEKREHIGGIDIHRVALPFRNYFGILLYVILSIPKFVRLARTHDVIHCHSFASGFAGAIARGEQQPFVLTIHTSHFNRLSRKAILRPFFRWMMKRADYIITASKELSVLTGAVIQRKDITPMPNAVSLKLFRQEEGPATTEGGEFLLMYSGHILEVKGVDVLIRALPLLEFDWKLNIIGEGVFEKTIRELADSLGVSGKIEFMGMVPHEEMPEHIRKANLVVIPSRIEATSIAALEAMACGRIVVASNTGGLPEIVREEWGYLFEREDHEDLARALTKAYEERERLEEMGRKAADFVEKNYSTARQGEIHDGIYRELLDEIGGKENE